MQSDRKQGPASAGPLFDAVARVTGAATGLVLVGLVSLVCLEALLRGGFNYSLGFAEELTGYGVVFMTFLGAALALRGHAMFQMHFLLDRWPEGTRRWVVRVFVLVALVICVILAWKTKDLTLSSFARGKFAPTLQARPTDPNAIEFSWLRSREGPIARADGYALELFCWLEKNRRPPNAWIVTKLREEASQNRSHAQAVRDRLAREVATEADHAWLGWYERKREEVEAIIAEGERQRAAA